MTQVTEEPGTEVLQPDAQPTEVLLPEVRQRTRRRRYRNTTVALLVIAVGALCYAVVGRGTSSPSGSSVGAANPPLSALPSAVRSSAVAMSTRMLPSNGDTLTTYYSGTGTMMEETLRSQAGVVQSIVRVVYQVADGQLRTAITKVFPMESSWASSFNRGSGGCVPCHADAYLYPSPPLIRRLLLAHQMQLSKQVTQINGRSVVQLVQIRSASSSSGSGPLVWVDPTNDEVVRFLPSPNAPLAAIENFTWLPNTSANLSHLLLPIPSGY